VLVEATGKIDPDGAVLRLGDVCPTPSSTFPLIEAAGIEGAFTDAHDEPITDGYVPVPRQGREPPSSQARDRKARGEEGSTPKNCAPRMRSR
jgi:hypothetical protein